MLKNRGNEHLPIGNGPLRVETEPLQDETEPLRVRNGPYLRNTDLSCLRALTQA